MKFESILVSLTLLKYAIAGIDNGVIVTGTTTPPGLNRPEGIGKIKDILCPEMHLKNLKEYIPKATLQCPASHPLACGKGTRCTAELFDVCNNELNDIYSEVQCCPSDAVPCAINPQQKCRGNTFNTIE